jgi:hypothetical protein
LPARQRDRQRRFHEKRHHSTRPTARIMAQRRHQYGDNAAIVENSQLFCAEICAPGPSSKQRSTGPQLPAHPTAQRAKPPPSRRHFVKRSTRDSGGVLRRVSALSHPACNTPGPGDPREAEPVNIEM